jgi:hypothetical protein
MVVAQAAGRGERTQVDRVDAGDVGEVQHQAQRPHLAYGVHEDLA